MKSALIISSDLSKDQMENSYLLCLALLNFDHQVSVVFVDHAFNEIASDPENKKRWLALKLFGAEHFYWLNKNTQTVKQSASIQKHCQPIDLPSFNALISQMDCLI